MVLTSHKEYTVLNKRLRVRYEKKISRVKPLTLSNIKKGKVLKRKQVPINQGQITNTRNGSKSKKMI